MYTKTRRKAYYQENREKALAQTKAWEKANPEKRKNSRLKYAYGITIEEYQKLWDLQKGLCAICGEPETNIDHRTKQNRRLAVDHNHETKKVRGLLCTKCNKGIGLLGDDSEILQNAANYMRQL